jgi:mannosyltransferase OCH1-like enzyme
MSYSLLRFLWMVLFGFLNKMEHLYLVDLPTAAPTAPLLIPKLLHMIWVGDSPAPPLVEIHRAAWATLLGPEWTIRLWTNADIAEFGPSVQAFVGAAVKGVQKADILYYHILERYGGIYMDADVIPNRTLDPVLWLQKSLVVCHDIPIEWPYIAKGFAACVPHHPVLQRGCELVLRGTLNTDRPHFETGPRVFGEAIHQCRPEPTAALRSDMFYHNEGNDARLGCHTYARMWDT